MYIFEAHYINMDTDKEITKKIEIDGQFYDTETEVYLCAMATALGMRHVNEMFSDLEFIAC